MDNWGRKIARSRRNASHTAAAAAGARRSFTLRCGEVGIKQERKHQVGT